MVRSAAFRFTRLWVRMPPTAWLSVPFECCVLSGGSLFVGLIIHPEDSYILCMGECVCVSLSMIRCNNNALIIKDYVYEGRIIKEKDFQLTRYRSNSTSGLYTGCKRRNGPDFGRVFLMLYYTDITQNTCVQS